MKTYQQLYSDWLNSENEDDDKFGPFSYKYFADLSEETKEQRDRILKQERNKAIDAAISNVKAREKEEYNTFLEDSEDKHAYGKYCAFSEIAQMLESLKH